MPSAGFKPAIPAGERLQTHALDRSATGIGSVRLHKKKKCTSTYIKTVIHNVNVKVNVIFAIEETMKAQRNSRGIALLFL
jgi:hypothetical protein